MQMNKIVSSYIIFGLVAIAALAIAIPVYFATKKQNEQTFQVKGWQVKRCPFPIAYHAEEGIQDSTAEAVQQLNNELMDLGYGPIFKPARMAPKGSILVTVKEAKEPMQKPGELCAPLNIGPTPPVDDRSLAMGDFKYKAEKDELQYADVYMCVRKYELAKSALMKPDWMRLVDLRTYIKHELMHSILGRDHPKTGCGLTCQNIASSKVTPSTRTIIRRIYNKHCLRR